MSFRRNAQKYKLVLVFLISSVSSVFLRDSSLSDISLWRIADAAHISESYAGAGVTSGPSHTASVSGDTGDMSSDIDEECDSIYSTPKCKPPGEP